MLATRASVVIMLMGLLTTLTIAMLLMLWNMRIKMIVVAMVLL